MTTRFARLLERSDVRGRALEDVRPAAALLRALGREVASRSPAGIGGFHRIGRAERRQQAIGAGLQRTLPLGLAQIERGRLERLIGRGDRLARLPFSGAQGFARRVIVGDQLDAGFARFFDLRPEEDDRAAGVVEQRVETRMEQRQPVLLAGVLAARADRFVERIVVGDRTECGDIAGAEAADGFGIERRFGCG